MEQQIDSLEYETKMTNVTLEDGGDEEVGATIGLGVAAGNCNATDDVWGARAGAVPTTEATPTPASNASIITTIKVKDVIA